MTTTPREVLDFWFLPASDPGHGQPRDEWFDATDAFNDELRRRFEDATRQARRGELDDWRATAEGSLALLLLLDQVPRNLHGDGGDAFASDSLARTVTRDALSRGLDQQVMSVARWFLYMPLMHSESLHDQDLAVTLFTSLGDGPGNDESVKAAHAHRDVIARFGRFPHRNRALGRTTTDEEEAFLATAPPPFGHGTPDD